MPWSSARSRILRALGTAASVVFVPVAGRNLEEFELAALVFPSVLYLGLIVAGSERLAMSRCLGFLALSSFLPASYGAIAGRLGETGLFVWMAAASLPALALEGRARLKRARARARRLSLWERLAGARATVRL